MIVFQPRNSRNITEVTAFQTKHQISNCLGNWPHYFRTSTSNLLKRRREMNRQRQSATWLGAALGTLCALLTFALASPCIGSPRRAHGGVPPDIRDHRRWADRTRQHQWRCAHFKLGSQRGESRCSEIRRHERAAGRGQDRDRFRQRLSFRFARNIPITTTHGTGVRTIIRQVWSTR